VIFYK